MHLAWLGTDGRRIRMHLKEMHPARDASGRSEKLTSCDESSGECGCIHGCICSQMQMLPWMHRQEDASKFGTCIQPMHPGHPQRMQQDTSCRYLDPSGDKKER
ncbi:hypothetical protein EXIGLDRAFT_723595 [Exidia glandulosa HHB12029]|uniref:Uncharacterized protein n=1 Tax=Exidia glandulosa HHB12029 TaxID=1314781 RepID=A0A165MYJ2_EXIGL|nr:hypothetical protein EXIGLDRAFT_723595 [Exidia glandulosa HHB12029]